MRIHTAKGPITENDLGATLMHEHLVGDLAGWESDPDARGSQREDLVKRCVGKIEELEAAGFTTLLDPLPIDLGRDLELYGEVAARTGFNILFATGLYNEKYGSPYWRIKIGFDPDGAQKLAAMYVKELTQGVGNSGLKPAVIKLAIGTDPSSAYEAALIRAAAMAANETNTPILTHTEGVGGDLLLGKLKALGVAAHRIIIGHSCTSSDGNYHRRIVDGGGYIGFDRFGLELDQTDEVRTRTLFALMRDGYAQQVIASHDCLFCERGRATPDSILANSPLHFMRDIAPRLRAMGISERALHGLFNDNPRRYFCGEVPSSQDSLS